MGFIDTLLLMYDICLVLYGLVICMGEHKVLEMNFSKIYGLLVNKAEKKGRIKAEVDMAARWLTGYSQGELDGLLASDITYGEFFRCAPHLNPDRVRIKGAVCGVRVETVADPLMREARYLDKLVDELAKGKSMEKVLRTQGGDK